MEKKKIAVITGGSSGIGKAIVENLANQNYEVVNADIQRDGGSPAQYFECDVTKAQDIARLYEFVNRQMGTPDVLISNAGQGWEDFRNELAAKEEAIGEGFRQEDNQVATAWERLNDDYSYQTVYHYRDGELWLQTYYRGNNPTSATDSLSNEEGQLLTRENATNPEFQDLWKRMEEKAQNLFN